MSEHHRSHRKFRLEEKCAAVLRILAGETVEQVAEDVGASAPRVARWHSIFLSGGRDAIAKSEFEAHRTQGFFERHRTAVFQWTVVTLTLLVALAVLTHFATTALP